MFDNNRVTAEIFHIQRALGEAVALPQGKRLVEGLRRELDRPISGLLRQSLLSDCVRVAYSAIITGITVRERGLAELGNFLAAAARHYAAMLPASYGEFAAIDPRGARTFLHCYAVDDTPFGRRATPRWHGWTLCRDAEAMGHRDAMARYARLLSWLLSEAYQLVAPSADLRWHGQVKDTEELDELRVLLGDRYMVEPAPDGRIRAFLQPTRVFSAVQQASSIFETDPFDVETLHVDARREFARLVDFATAATPSANNGWMLLLLGNSGSGKTHLLRSFRHQVQEFGRGFVVYAPFNASSDDYPRYLLQHVVDSLSRAYTGSAGDHTGLYQLASGLIELADDSLRTQLQAFTEGEWESTETANTFNDYVRELAGQLQHRPDLQSFDPDLIRILLFALYPAAGMTSRIYRYLRCLDMSTEDRQWLGNVMPRTGKDDPTWMIRDLARIAFVARRGAMVLMVDQAERAVTDSATGSAALRRAIDTLQGIVSEVPSTIAVMSYLTDLYEIVRPELTKSVLDRLENTPPPVRLKAGRSYDDVQALVSQRLAWRYAEAGAVYRAESPVYPIPEASLRAHVGSRSRDVLDWCHRYQSQCVAAGRIVDPGKIEEGGGTTPDDDLEQIATAWSAAQLIDFEVADGEDEILAALVRAAADCAVELGLAFEQADATKDNLRAVRLSFVRGSARTEVVLAMTNRGPQAGAFGSQLAALRKAAKTALAIAVRTAAFPHGVASEKAMDTFGKAGGRCVSLDAATLREIVAFQRFRPAFPAARVAAWRQLGRPMSSLPLLAELFQLDRLGVVPPSQPEPPDDSPSSNHGTDSAEAAPRRKPRARAPSQSRRRQSAV